MSARSHFIALALSLSLPFAAQAHRVWIVPAATVLSGDDPWVTFDAAVSNDIFHTDYHPLSTDNLQALGPDAQPVPLANAHSGRFRSVFDLQLATRGTYKVFMASHGLSASWTDNGERRGWPGRGQAFDPTAFSKAVPAKAENLVITRSSRRIETFVTSGAPTEDVLAVTGLGLELKPLSHPNDLFAEEPAEFQLLIDGKPAQGAEVTVLPEGMRYRNEQEAIEVTTDAEGRFSVTWPRAGRYFLETGYQDDRADPPATQRRGSYTATFEVLPAL